MESILQAAIVLIVIVAIGVVFIGVFSDDEH